MTQQDRAYVKAYGGEKYADGLISMSRFHVSVLDWPDICFFTGISTSTCNTARLTHNECGLRTGRLPVERLRKGLLRGGERLDGKTVGDRLHAQSVRRSYLRWPAPGAARQRSYAQA